MQIQISPDQAVQNASELPRSVSGSVTVSRQERDLAAFSYLLVMSLVVYGLRRHSPFVRFHSKQAIVLFALSFLFWFIPWFGKPLELLVLVGILYGFGAAAQGQWKEVPVVGPLVRMSPRDVLLDVLHLPRLLLQAMKHLPSSARAVDDLSLAQDRRASILSADSSLPPRS